jgi:hypothetical protein
VQLRVALGAPKARCLIALAEAGKVSTAARLARRAHGRKARQYTARMRTAAGRALARLAACIATPPPPPSEKPQIAGRVVNSVGTPLANLAVHLVVTTSPRGELYGNQFYDALTAADGSFTIPVDPAKIGGLRYRAEARLPWRGGAWQRDLTPLSTSDPAHLQFRVDVYHLTDPFGNVYGNGPVVTIDHGAGCDRMDDDPSYPISDAGTHGFIFRFEPDGPMLDGSSAQPFTRKITDKTAVCGLGVNVEVPAGAWFVSATTDTGRAVAINIFTSDDHDYYLRPLLDFASQANDSRSVNLGIAYAN